jgi:hypothetical protein
MRAARGSGYGPNSPAVDPVVSVDRGVADARRCSVVALGAVALGAAADPVASPFAAA